MHHDPARAVLRAARSAARETGTPMLLAVSGGLDSMTLLSAMSLVARRRIAAVATFDHGTGRAATAAVGHVCRAAAVARVPVVVGHMDAGTSPRDGLEATWRKARLSFLDSAASRLGARVVTAHTEDDQIETVLMRIMRGSGARGLAGLHANSAMSRPFLTLRRESLATYARAHDLRWIDDPSNASMRFARNRVRHDLLPALRQVNPSIDAALVHIASLARALRTDVDAFVNEHVRPELEPARRMIVASSGLVGYDRDSLALLWAALAARTGLALDHRGTRRIVTFTSSGTPPRTGMIPLAGGWCLEARRTAYILEKRSEVRHAGSERLPLAGSLEWGSFRFHVSSRADESSAWSASLPVGAGGMVRAWGAGDRLAASSGRPRRRVKRYLSDFGVHGGERQGWPVVVSGGEVVWIPGVRRSDAATDRSGRPVLHYLCERTDR